MRGTILVIMFFDDAGKRVSSLPVYQSLPYTFFFKCIIFFSQVKWTRGSHFCRDVKMNGQVIEKKKGKTIV